ncbi:MAG: PD-(D/E)XK nuclease family protein [Halanaeroarchaeum sp.]
MTDAETVRDRLTDADFPRWYRARQERQNARRGKFAWNSPTDPPDPPVHRPHTLLTCHRKQRYREENAPAETALPAGRFWVGSRIEEDLVLEYLTDVAPEDLLVGNSLWVDAPVSAGETDLRIRGATDPVFATPEGTPVLPTEVKTTSSLEHVDGPDERHRAQLHAYLAGLSATRDVDLEEGVLVYVSRETLDVRVVPVPFDESFWRDRVVPWMTALSGYRESAALPPASPEQDWECDTCEFRARCGRTDDPVSDLGTSGFVPGVVYPRHRVETALAADEDLDLTPTLAATYPDLAAGHSVADWRCEACGATHAPDRVDADDGPPTCERCASAGRFARLRGPVPDSPPVR